jgi:hypothetical protein
LTELRRLQLNAEQMARLSPFKADREKFGRIAERYRQEAEALKGRGGPPAPSRNR